MSHEPLSDGGFESIHASQVAPHFGGALSEAGAEFVGHAAVGHDGTGGLLPLELLQVLDGHLQDVGFFEFGVPRVIFFKGIQDEILQLGETVVDASSAPFLHDGLRAPSQFTGLAGRPVCRHGGRSLRFGNNTGAKELGSSGSGVVIQEVGSSQDHSPTNESGEAAGANSEVRCEERTSASASQSASEIGRAHV